LINEITPVETYNVKGKPVYVKRDDLMGDGDHPPWGKLTALRNTVKKLNPTKPLIHLSVYGSWSGWALSEVTKHLGYEFIMAYPDTTRFPKHILEKSENVLPIKPNMMNVMYNKVGQIARENNYIRLPYAFDHDTYIETQRKRFKDVRDNHNIDHLVVASGSGVTCLGMMLEFQPWSSLFEPRNNRTFHTVCVSSEGTIKKKFLKHQIQPSEQIEIVKSEFEFDDMMEWYETPFPCNEFWDKKAWYWLEQNIEKFEGDILFWNLGGNW
jgi:1-aminocyclopropane-1-carboxylate deaminase/D-cysteine desulfhydrase-like pyridoxal-dependent ACC family enzyme